MNICNTKKMLELRHLYFVDIGDGIYLRRSQIGVTRKFDWCLSRYHKTGIDEDKK